MLVHVTRSAFPRLAEDYWSQIDNDGQTNFEMLRAGVSFGGWSLPVTSMTGHPVWFQITKTSYTSACGLLRDAESDGDEELAAEIRNLLPELERWSGSLVAVGRVHGAVHRSTPVDSHFRGRIFAPVVDITPLTAPVPTTMGSKLSAVSAFAHTASQRTNRLIGGNTEYALMLREVRRAGNAVPPWAEVDINAVHGDWLTIANDVQCSWLSESQLADQFAIPLCREMADRRRVNVEVNIRPDAVARKVGWAVDALIEIDGTPLPVEFKLDRRGEADLRAQLLQYTGPSAAEKSTGARVKRWRVDHPFVLVVDRVSADLYENGERASGHKAAQLLRGQVTHESIAELRSTLADRIRGRSPHGVA
jgi:hypothetical protein